MAYEFTRKTDNVDDVMAADVNELQAALEAIGVSKFVCNGRLTLESGVPVSTSDQANKTTLYFTPYKGNEISLYDGTNWIKHEFTERSLALGALTPSGPHDIFIYDNEGTLTLSATAWTNYTTRATALTTQDGVYVKSGATGYRYLGTIYMDAESMCQDTNTKRFVWNYYNQVERNLFTAETTSHTYNGGVRLWNNSSTNNLLEVVCGMSWISATAYLSSRLLAGADGSAAWTYIYKDASAFVSDYLNSIKNHNVQYIQATAAASGRVGAGYHYFNVRELGNHENSTFFYMGLNVHLMM